MNGVNIKQQKPLTEPKSTYAELCANFCNERALELKKKQLKSIAVDVPNKLSPLEARNSY